MLSWILTFLQEKHVKVFIVLDSAGAVLKIKQGGVLGNTWVRVGVEGDGESTFRRNQ